MSRAVRRRSSRTGVLSARWAVLDVSNGPAVARVIADAVAQDGQLDILVANAGAGFHGSLLDTSPLFKYRITGAGARP